MSDSTPPNNTEAERAFLGSVLLAPEIFNNFSSYIKPEDFYLLRNRHIWEVMRNLFEEGIHLDYLTLYDGLNSKGWLEEVGEDAYLIQMIQDTPTALHAESYARIVKDKANKRRIAELSMKVVQNAYSDKTFLDLHEDVGNLVTGYSALPGNSERLVYSAEQLCSSEVGELTWILKDWIMAGGINLIAGMPAAGKSFLALDLAIGIASTGFAWNDQPVPLGKVTYHFLDGSFRGMRSRVLKLCNARGIQPPANLTFDFSPLSLREPHEVLALKQRISSQGVSVVIFDVMAKFAPGADENSVAEMSPLMNSMREIANQLGTTFILIHHLNKGISNDFSYRVRGSTDILGSVDTAIIVNYENSSAANSMRVIQPQKMREAELQKGLGPRTVRVVHNILHASLDKAVRYGLVIFNPTHGATLPRYSHEEMTVLDSYQVGDFLVAAQNSPHYAFFHLAITTGMRMGELFGLKWSDIQWNAGVLHVQRQKQYVPGQGCCFIEPKTNAERRTIKLGEDSLDVLRHHKAYQAMQRERAGDRWHDMDLVFCSSVETPGDASNVHIVFNSILELAGLPKMRFHDLRHTAASLLLNNKVPVIVVSSMLGHSKPSVTLAIYAHVFHDMQGEAAIVMDKLVTPILDEIPQEKTKVQKKDRFELHLNVP